MSTSESSPTRSRVFISYRREDTEHAVGRLAEDLREYFAHDQIFQDIASIDPGADFVEALQQGLETCAAVLVIIGPRWLTVADRQGRRRLDLPDDWVRHEVAESLRHSGVRVFPVLLDAAMPSAEDLPEEIRPLTRRQAFPLTVRHWANDVAQLVEFLNKVAGLGQTPTHEVTASQATPGSESAKPPARAVKVDRPSAASQSRPAAQGESARAGSALGAEETQKRGEDIRPAPVMPAMPLGRGDAPVRSKVLWGLVALGTVVASALLLFALRSGAPGPQPAPPYQRESPARSFHDCFKCPRMIVVPAGNFLMGSPANDVEGIDDERPQHEVRIGKPIAVGRYEVTFDEWEACFDSGDCKDRHDNGWGRGKRPVVNVSWDDAQAYIGWLSKKTGHRYRLLSEAEWEYAARAGTTTRYPWGDEPGSNLANFKDSGSPWGGAQTAPVGSFEPNKFGLHDMVGNVWEWVQDCSNSRYSGAPTDGSAREEGDCGVRMRRGGGFGADAVGVRAATRGRFEKHLTYKGLGFRVVRDL